MPSDVSTKPSDESVIFSMPEEFRHGASGTIVKPEVKAPVSKPAPVQPKPTAPLSKKPKKTIVSKKLLIVGGIVIVGFVIAGAIILQSLASQEPVEEEVPIVDSRPTEQVVEEPVEEVVEEPAEEELIEEPAELFEAEASPGKDSDSDGLSDLEETLIYETDVRLPDTDGDGFLDGNEVFNGYHPNGFSPETLLDLQTVDQFTWQETVILYHPSNWEVLETEESLVFVATTGEQFTMVRVDFGLEEITEEQIGEKIFSSTTKNQLEMIVTEDQRKAYVAVNGFVYRFTYDVGIKGTVDYLQTFQMMLNSLSLAE